MLRSFAGAAHVQGLASVDLAGLGAGTVCERTAVADIGRINEALQRLETTFMLDPPAICQRRSWRNVLYVANRRSISGGEKKYLYGIRLGGANAARVDATRLAGVYLARQGNSGAPE